jgi:glucose-1-phosphate adenylyltransferase
MILAGGEGGRLELLTEHRAKPAVPFAGDHRLIDVVLSNCRHAGIDDVWVLEQYNPVSLADHLANGRPWDLDRTHGGLLLLHPRLGDDREGWHQGTADALWRNADLVRGHAPDALVLLSADAVYRLDYEEVIRGHLDSGAALTAVTVEVDPEDAGRYGVVEVGKDGRITDYELKPEHPRGNLVTNEVFVLDPGPVLDLLERLAKEAGEDDLQDLGHGLLPALVEAGQARAHHFDGYWRDLGKVDAYWAAHQDLVADEPPFPMEQEGWRILTRPAGHGPARVRAGASVAASLLSPGADVAGTVERSVLSPGVVVEAGATVRNAVLLHDVVVRAGASVQRAVVDAGTEVSAGITVGGDSDVALVGGGLCLDVDVPAGGRYPEPDDD